MSDAATLRDGCPACEDGYICRHGDGCIVDEAFGPTDSQKRRDAAAAFIREETNR